jgi:hypothetical protein
VVEGAELLAQLIHPELFDTHNEAQMLFLLRCGYTKTQNSKQIGKTG